MQNIIKLHNYENNTPIGISPESISVIFTTTIRNGDNTRQVSEVNFTVDTNIKGFYVNETPEKIFQMFDLPDFIKLHTAHDNGTVLVNKECICIIDTEVCPGRPKSRIYFYTNSNVKAFVVNESTEKIVELFNQNKEDKKISQDQPKDQ